MIHFLPGVMAFFLSLSKRDLGGSFNRFPSANAGRDA
jgi:hypothetical protein